MGELVGGVCGWVGGERVGGRERAKKSLGGWESD